MNGINAPKEHFAARVRPDFVRERAFSRTLGFVTRAELATLAQKTVAIAGLGGVGGYHLLTLARLGIGGFRLAEMDSFELENFNRQAGAFMSTIGRPKIDVMIEQALDINPDLRIERFPSGVNPGNLDSFLAGANIYIDGLDYFAFDIRSAVFAKCRSLGISAVTAGPIGMGAALLTFNPDGMSFDDYFHWRPGDSDEQKAVHFLAGLAPTLPHRSYLVDPSFVRFRERRGPSTPMACELCAGMAGVETLKILLGRGRVEAAPVSLHFDAYINQMRRRRIWFGNRHPLQRLKIWLALRQLERNEAASIR